MAELHPTPSHHSPPALPHPALPATRGQQDSIGTPKNEDLSTLLLPHPPTAHLQPRPHPATTARPRHPPPHAGEGRGKPGGPVPQCRAAPSLGPLQPGPTPPSGPSQRAGPGRCRPPPRRPSPPRVPPLRRGAAILCVCTGYWGGAAHFRLSRGFPSLSRGDLGISAPSPPPTSAARGAGTGLPRPYGLIGRVPAPPPPRVSLASEMAAQVLGKALVSSKWLAEAVKAGRVGAGLRVLDASWYPPQERNARQEFRESHIPGASFFDIEECRDKSSPYDFMLPSEAGFADYVGQLGIGNDTHVVVYDGDKLGTFYAPRAWWMFRVFGHRQVSVLNGGFKNWVKEGHPVTAEVSQPTPAVFKAKLDKSLLKTFEEMMENVGSKQFQVVDSRPEGRFRGTELDQGKEGGTAPDPCAGLG